MKLHSPRRASRASARLRPPKARTTSAALRAVTWRYRALANALRTAFERADVARDFRKDSLEQLELGLSAWAYDLTRLTGGRHG